MDANKIVAGTIISAVSIVLLMYNAQNPETLAKLISIGMFGLIIGIGFLLIGMLTSAKTD